MAARKKVLVTGANGMLGTDLVARLTRARKYDVVAVDLDEMDITRLASVKSTLLEHRPQHVIHCAAYTKVDQAERERERAMAVNAEGTKNVAFFCRELGAEMMYISTDYVFDGARDEAYGEADATNPINVYGQSKLAGEHYVATLVDHHKICRTSWLCGVHGHCFIESILQAIAKGRPLSVVSDQIGRPTFTFDLADVLVRLLACSEYGIFHITNAGYCSWYEFANEIVQASGIEGVKVQPVTTAQFRSLARRPAYSVLRNGRLAEMRFRPLPRWETSLREYLERRARLGKPAAEKPGSE